jgi:radial spoke head protein 4A
MIWENIYIGYGHKYSTNDYRPDLPPMPASEYTDGPEIAEADDPTAEDEEKARAAAERPEEGEEEGEEEVENDDEDD